MEKGTYILHLTERELRTLQEWSSRSADGARMDPAASLDGAETLEALERELRYARPRSLEELVSFGKDRLREDYYGDVRSMAEELLREVLDEETDEDSAREALEERLLESVDGSAWVIYNARALDVLRVSENDGYSLENFGTDGIVEDGAVQWSRLAFGALYADVSERLWADFEDWTETRDSFEEELQERGVELESVELRDSGDSFADRFLVSFELPDGTPLHFRMSSDATSPGGVCQTSDGSTPEESKVRGSIVSPDVPEAVREQVLRILDASSEDCARTVEALRETLRSTRDELARALDALSAEEREPARTVRAEQVSALEASAVETETALDELRELAEAWGIDVDGE